MKPSTAQRRACCVIAMALLFALTSFAQSTGGRIIGRVTDSSGAVVPNAKVTITNDATSISRNTVTDSNGDYNFPAVAVGTYTVTFESKGFQKVIRKGVTVDVNQVVTLNTPLAVGAGEQTVEVTGEAPLVETTSTQLGAVVNELAMKDLPLNQRDTYQFLQLQPGVMSQLGGNSDLFYGSGSAGSVSVNGGRGRSNNFSVNGGDANDQFVNLPTVQPSPDTIAEFRVLTNTFDAEYGRNSGSIVNVITKSGSNNWHGSVYEFLRNSVLNSRGFFDTVKPDFIMNQFGGTFGGPIRKDKTFFFASYEGRRIKQGRSSDVVTVPTDAERTGNFGGETAFSGTLNDPVMAGVLNGRPGCTAAITGLGGAAPAAGLGWNQIFPTNVIPTACIDPLSADLMNVIPHGNLPGGLFQTVANAIENQDQFTARVDHVLKSNQQLSAYYYFTNHNLLQPFAFFQAAGANVPGFGSLVGERFQQINISHTWTISNTSVNEFRFTYNREAQATFQHPQHTSDIHQSCPTLTGDACFGGTSPLGINPGLGPTREGLPFIVIAGGATIGNNFEGELPQVGNTFQWSDNFTKIVGNHTLKFGADIRRQRFEQFLYFNVNGEYFFDSSFSSNTVLAANEYPNFLLGIPDDYSQGSGQIEHVRDTGVALFAQDSWKIKPNLTLNYGLRWEFLSPIADISGHVQTFRPGQVTTQFPCQLTDPVQIGLYGSADCSPTGPAAALNPLGLVFPGDKGVPAGLTQTYYRSFAPRIGLAWSPNADSGWLRKLTGGPGRTSIRTGFGLFYNPIEQLVLEQFGAEPPFGGSNFIGSPQFNTPFVDQSGNIFPNPFVNGVLTPRPGTPIDWSSFRSVLLFGEFQPKMRPQYSEQYHFTIQREIGNSMVLQVGYVGSQAHRLLMSHDLNAVPLGLCNQLNQLVPLAPGDTNTFDLFCTPNNGDGFYFVDPTTPVPAGMTSITLPYGGPNGGPLTVPLTPGSTVGATAPNGITLVGLRPFSSPLCNPLAPSGSIASHCPIDGIPVFTNIYAQDTIGNSNYNSLQASLEKRFSHGLQFQLAYTYSKSIDQGSSFEDILNPSNFAATRGLSLFDARHRFVISYYWEFPVPKYTGLAGKALNGWALSGITTFQAGFPIRIVSFDDNEMQSSTFDFIAAGEPDQLAPFHTQDPHNGACALGTGPTALVGSGGPVPCQPVPNMYFDPNIFTAGPAGTGDLTVDPSMLGRYGTAPRTICCGPGINNFDIALLKATPINERFSVQFRAEFFNAFNHTQFFNPDGSVTDGADFGRIKRAHDPRLVQFALKLIF